MLVARSLVGLPELDRLKLPDGCCQPDWLEGGGEESIIVPKSVKGSAQFWSWRESHS